MLKNRTLTFTLAVAIIVIIAMLMPFAVLSAAESYHTGKIYTQEIALTQQNDSLPLSERIAAMRSTYTSYTRPATSAELSMSEVIEKSLKDVKTILSELDYTDDVMLAQSNANIIVYQADNASIACWQVEMIFKNSFVSDVYIVCDALTGDPYNMHLRLNHYNSSNVENSVKAFLNILGIDGDIVYSTGGKCRVDCSENLYVVAHSYDVYSIDIYLHYKDKDYESEVMY